MWYVKATLIFLCVAIPTKLWAFSLYYPNINIEKININKYDLLFVDKLSALKIEDQVVFQKQNAWQEKHYLGILVKLENNIAFIERDEVIYDIPVDQIVGRIRFKIWNNK